MIEKPMLGRTDAIYWYILQTHDTAEVAFNRYLNAVKSTEIFSGKNESEKWVRLMGNRHIFFKSGENYEDLRIETLDGAIIDEYRQQHPELWPRIIRPMLGRRKGWAEFLSTANGFDHFHDLYEFAKADKTGQWETFHAPSTEAWWWTPEEIASVKATMSEAEFAQEILSEFRNIRAGRAYISHGEHNQLPYTLWPTSDMDRQVTDKLPVVLGLDFNLSPMSWHLGQNDRSKWYWFDEIHLENSHTQEATGLLIQKLLNLKARKLLRAQPNVIVCGDATGKAGQRAAAGQSDYDIVLTELRRHDITFENVTPDSNPGIIDRVNTMNSKLKAADGSVSFFYNPQTCPWLKKDFDQTTWKTQGVLDPGRNRELTHATDSVGYSVCVLTPMKSIVEVGVPRIVVL